MCPIYSIKDIMMIQIYFLSTETPWCVDENLVTENGNIYSIEYVIVNLW